MQMIEITLLPIVACCEVTRFPSIAPQTVVLVLLGCFHTGGKTFSLICVRLDSEEAVHFYSGIWRQ